MTHSSTPALACSVRACVRAAGGANLQSERAAATRLCVVLCLRGADPRRLLQRAVLRCNTSCCADPPTYLIYRRLLRLDVLLLNVVRRRLRTSELPSPAPPRAFIYRDSSARHVVRCMPRVSSAARGLSACEVRRGAEGAAVVPWHLMLMAVDAALEHEADAARVGEARAQEVQQRGGDRR